MWPLTTTAAPTATSTRCAMSRSRAACTTATRPPGSPHRAPRSTASRRSRMASSAAGCCSTSPGCGMCPGWSPGEHVLGEELEAAERAQGVTVGTGDILLVRTGHTRRLTELGPWDTAAARAGLHPTAMAFVAERRVAALGSDGNSDTAPSTTEGVAFPIHVLAINAMGVRLLDYLQLESLRQTCEAARRWEFLFMAAPLRILGGTSSPLNPITVL